jgi:hypothetical protein
VIGPIPLTSSVTEEPTYEQRADGSFNTYIKFKGILVVESGLTPFHAHRMADSRGRRREWPHERRGWRPHVADSVRPGQPEVLGDAGGGACIRVPYRVAHGDGTGQVSARASARLRERRGPGWQFVFLLQRYFPFAGDPQRPRVNQLTLQPFVTKLLPDAWYVQTQPVITLDFVHGPSRFR